MFFKNVYFIAAVVFGLFALYEFASATHMLSLTVPVEEAQAYVRVFWARTLLGSAIVTTSLWYTFLYTRNKRLAVAK